MNKLQFLMVGFLLGIFFLRSIQLIWSSSSWGKGTQLQTTLVSSLIFDELPTIQHLLPINSNSSNSNSSSTTGSRDGEETVVVAKKFVPIANEEPIDKNSSTRTTNVPTVTTIATPISKPTMSAATSPPPLLSVAPMVAVRTAISESTNITVSSAFVSTPITTISAAAANETMKVDYFELDSEEWFWGNSANYTFTTHVRISKTTAQICLDVLMQQPACPYPYIRARVSGDAIVNVPMRLTANAIASSIVTSGCALLPMAGKYYLDMNILHCTMNPAEMGTPHLNLRTKCPLHVWKRDVKNFTFHIPPFVRDDASVYTILPEDRKNIFPYRAWIYAPRCAGKDMLAIGPYCTAATEAPIARTPYQDELRLPTFNVQADIVFRDYVFLPVDQRTGQVDYNAFHWVPLYAPSLPGLNASTNSDIICFLGDSHARYLSYIAKMIFYNQTRGQFGCNNKNLHTGWIGPDTTLQFRYFKMEFAHTFLGQQNMTIHFEPCDMIVTLFGHWHAGTGRKPTAPADFADGAMRVMNLLQNMTRNSTRIYMLSPEANPVSWRVLGCVDWRTPVMMEAYNACLRNRTVPTTMLGDDNEIVIDRKFFGLQNAFYLDNSDIMDPLWDEAIDWNHPCRFAFRAMAYRVLLLMSRRITP